MKTWYFIPLLTLSIFISGLLSGWQYIDGLTFNAFDFALILLLVAALTIFLFYLEKKWSRTYHVIACLFLSLYLAIISTNLYVKLPPLSGKVVNAHFKIQAIVMLVFLIASLRSKKIMRFLFIFSLIFILSDITLQLINHKNNTDYFNGAVKSKSATFSSNHKNIILIIIDTARADIFNAALMNAHINGLTVYNNYYSNYSSTFTSVPYILSGIHPLGLTFTDYSKQFTCHTIQASLLQKGWDVYNFPYEYLKETLPIDKCNTSHIGYFTATIKQNFFERIWLAINVYMYKQNLGNLFGRHGVLKKAVALKAGSDNMKFQELLQSNVAKTKNNVFAFYHFNGLHAPVNKISLTSNVRDDYIARANEIANTIKIFSTMLKEKGISNNTRIIIMGDHGTYVPELSYSSVKVNHLGFKKNIIHFDSTSNQAMKLRALYGNNLPAGHFFEVLKNSGINGDHFNTLLGPVTYTQSKMFMAELALAKAAFAIISPNDYQITYNNKNIFSGFVRDLIFDFGLSQKTNHQNNIIYTTPFSGNLDHKPIISSSKCNVTENKFTCVPLNNGKNKIKNDSTMENKISTNNNYINIIFDNNHPDGWDKNCRYQPLIGSNMYPIDALKCLKNVPAEQVRIFDSYKMNDIEISHISVDSGGIKSLIGFDIVMKSKNSDSGVFYSKHISTTSKNGLAEYTLKACSLNVTLTLPTGVLFEINDKHTKKCHTTMLSNANPLIPSLETKFSKDARIINSQIASLSFNSHPTEYSIAGISYPNQSDHPDKQISQSKWIASYPFKIFTNTCKGKINIHLYPSKTGEVTIKGYKNGRLIAKKYISADEKFPFTREFCGKDKKIDEVVFTAQKNHFTLADDPRIYAAQLIYL